MPDDKNKTCGQCSVGLRMNALWRLSGCLGRIFPTECVLNVFVAFVYSQMECCWTETTVVVELLIWILYREELDVLNHSTENVAIIITPRRNLEDELRQMVITS